MRHPFISTPSWLASTKQKAITKPQMITLSVLSLNCWHGLDHRNPYLMWPLESQGERKRRLAQLTSNLRHWKMSQPGLCLVSLQELNPVIKLARKMRKTLSLNFESFRVNHGLKIGLVSYPFYLSEGLASFWSPNLKLLSTSRLDLSGSAWGFRQSNASPFCLQLKECRGALFNLLKFGQKTLLHINTHLHHSQNEEGIERRLSEIRTILNHVDSHYSGADITCLTGDLNCWEGGSEFELLHEAGFKENSERKLGTWNPIANPLCSKLLRLDHPALDNKPVAPMHLDHILVKVASSSVVESTPVKMEFTDSRSLCSDHYGTSCTLSLD